MDCLVSNIIYRVPTIGGPTVRIRVQTFADGDACFIAAPSQGDIDEPPAMNAIASLQWHLANAHERISVTEREYRFLDDDGLTVIGVPDTVIVPGGARRIRELLMVIHRAPNATPI